MPGERCPKCEDLIKRKICGMCAECWNKAQERNRRPPMDNRNTLDPLPCPFCPGEVERSPTYPSYMMHEGEAHGCPLGYCCIDIKTWNRRPAPEASPPAQAPAPVREDGPKRVIHNSLCHLYGKATAIAAQIILSSLQDAGYIHKDGGLMADVLKEKGSEGTGPEAPETAEREKTARLILWLLQDQRVFPPGAWEEYDDATRAQMLQYADRFREAAPASVRPSAEPS
jgi:hypothetical protein